MSEYKTENLNHRISIYIFFLFIIPEHESAKENNMFLTTIVVLKNYFYQDFSQNYLRNEFLREL
jgi:hypothetical protein